MKTVMSGINKVYDGFNKINEWFIIFLMALMCLDLLAQVVWMALLGSAWCGRNHLHVNMTVVTNRLPLPARRVQIIAISAICAITCFILFPHACSIFMAQSKLKAVTLGVSLGIEYIAAPVGIILMAVQWTIDALYALFDWEGYQKRYMKKED